MKCLNGMEDTHDGMLTKKQDTYGENEANCIRKASEFARKYGKKLVASVK